MRASDVSDVSDGFDRSIGYRSWRNERLGLLEVVALTGS